MPSVPPQVLIDAVLDAFQDSGFSGLLMSSPVKQPRQFLIQTEGKNVSVWIYIWTLTHGGRPSLPDEFRIQMTTVKSPLPLNPDGYTLLLGYDPNLKVFGGFDLNRHGRFKEGSPSVQIDRNCLYRALQDGMAFDRKDNNEVALGIRSDQFINYMANAEDLHKYGSKTAIFKLLIKATTLAPITSSELKKVPEKRRKIIATIKRLSRAANFRQKVLDAYGHRCAVTRLQLKLVDAAHILPVEAEDSVDVVQNGISLSPTIHRAFDSCLVYLDENFVMRLNRAKELQLTTLKLDGGLSEFKEILGNKIHLPADKNQWPDIRLIKKANEYRRISA